MLRHRRSQSSLVTAALSREKTKEDGEAELGVSSVRSGPEIDNAAMSGPSEMTRFAPGLSIDQSIKAFKTFELLRSGDPDKIKQALQENGSLKGTTVLHLAVQCASPAVIDQILRSAIDVDAQDKDGNSALHLAAILGRAALVKLLLDHQVDTSMLNYKGQTALDVARTPEIFQLLQLDRAMVTEKQIAKVHGLVKQGDYDGLEALLESSQINNIIDVNAMELASELSTVESGGTLLHEAARKKDIKLVQLLLLNGADPFRRDKKGRLPKDVTKDDKTRAILKKSPATTAAQRGVQEKAILGTNPASEKPMGRDSREIKGYLKKWTNYTSGYKLRWFVLEDGVLSYYKHQDDAGSTCRGAMNMKIAKLSMDTQDKTKFEIIGGSSVKYHLKANHEVETKRWFWALNNAIQWAKDEARQGDQKASNKANAQRQAISEQRAREVTLAEGRKVPTDIRLTNQGLVPTSANMTSSMTSKSSVHQMTPAAGSVTGDDISAVGSYEPSLAIGELNATQPDGHDDEYGEDASSHELRPESKDAFAITAQSANLQLEILQHVSQALETRIAHTPDTPISDADIQQAVSTYLSAAQSLRAMVANLQRITQDRDAYWQNKLDREVEMRRMWEESMARVVQDQEELEGKIGESEEKRKRTKRALREVLEVVPTESLPAIDQAESEAISPQRRVSYAVNRRDTIATIKDLSDSDSDLDEEEFFDAVGAGQVPVEQMPVLPAAVDAETPREEPSREVEKHPLEASFIGYEDPVRQKLKLDADDRPKISLWVSLLLYYRGVLTIIRAFSNL